MKERPILFSAPMVRAILDGRKTQTRRIAKLPDQRTRRGQWDSVELGGDGVRDQFGNPVTDPFPGLAHSVTGACISSPFSVGDRLWVRETWWERRDRTHESKDINAVRYVVDGEPPEPERWQKRVSIHMPRWASRITLEVTGVRVERLHDISNEDAKAEGVRAFEHDGAGVYEDYELGDGTWCNTARGSFATLWRSINGAESWAANPWVWVVEFKQVTP